MQENDNSLYNQNNFQMDNFQPNSINNSPPGYPQSFPPSYPPPYAQVPQNYYPPTPLQNVHHIEIPIDEHHHYHQSQDAGAACCMGCLMGSIFGIFGLFCICCFNDKCSYLKGFFCPMIVCFLILAAVLLVLILFPALFASVNF